MLWPVEPLSERIKSFGSDPNVDAVVEGWKRDAGLLEQEACGFAFECGRLLEEQRIDDRDLPRMPTWLERVAMQALADVDAARADKEKVRGNLAALESLESTLVLVRNTVLFEAMREVRRWEFGGVADFEERWRDTSQRSADVDDLHEAIGDLRSEGARSGWRHIPIAGDGEDRELLEARRQWANYRDKAARLSGRAHEEIRARVAMRDRLVDLARSVVKVGRTQGRQSASLEVQLEALVKQANEVLSVLGIKA